MATKGIRLPLLIGLLLFCAEGCVSTKVNTHGHSMPEDWAIAMSGDPKACTVITGNYQNFGVGKLQEGKELVQVRLDVALGYAFPTVEMPRQVRVMTNDGLDLLTYYFLGSVNETFTMPVSCSSGWFVSEKTSTNQYIGDGSNLDYSIRRIKLGKSVDGALIVHLTLETQSTTYWLFRAHDKREIWSRYEELKSED